MTRQEAVNLVIQTVEELRNTDFIPNPATRLKKPGSTGNMADNGLKYVLKHDGIVVYFDTKVAPYIRCTNEPWVAKRWHGKKNPNEGWWERFCDEFARRLAVKLKGDLKND